MRPLRLSAARSARAKPCPGVWCHSTRMLQLGFGLSQRTWIRETVEII